VTSRAEEKRGFEAARAAGASAYVVKSKAVRDLAEVVVSVARGTANSAYLRGLNGTRRPIRSDPTRSRFATADLAVIGGAHRG